MNKKMVIILVFALAFSLFAAVGNILATADTTNLYPPIRCVGTYSAPYKCLDSHDPNGPAYNFQDIAENNPALTFIGWGGFESSDDGVAHITLPFQFTYYKNSP